MEETNRPALHFIGIGGVGMSGIARVAIDQGYKVSGSDLKENFYTKSVRDAGVEVFVGHKASQVPEGNPIIVVSTAILDNNPELVEAKRRGLEIRHRSEMLVELGKGLTTLAVAGTHGKTTTSSMLASTMAAMGLDPTFLIGGTVRSFGSNSHSGTGKYYVVEADESDKSFTNLAPSAVIVTNIEADHLDHYKDLDEIYELFCDFIDQLPEDGIAVVYGDDEKVIQVAKDAQRPWISYGFGKDCDSQILSWKVNGLSAEFQLRLPSGKVVSSAIKQNPGRHNVLNGAAVITLLDALGYDAAEAADKLREFSGVRRRFDKVGEAKGVTVVDDYAHHPTEIAATIKAAKELDFNHVHVLFQPHRYTRAKLFTEVLRDDFARAFDDADSVTFMDVYSAGEVPIPGVTGKTFLKVVLDHRGTEGVYYVPGLIDVAPHMASLAEEGDLIITMGAGDVTLFGSQIVNALKKQEEEGRS